MPQNLLDWLIDINSVSNEEVFMCLQHCLTHCHYFKIAKYAGSESASTVATFLSDCGETCEFMLAFIDEHYDEGALLRPLLAQLLNSLKRGGE